MNLSSTIIPKSDQLNADDLISGPITIKITAVKSGSTEQPVVIHYENDNGRPYKPSKSMRRMLVFIWGNEGNTYIGRRITLYRDPLIKFGGDPVGGIRISHASDIAEPIQVALTETRGRRKLFRVEPLAAEQSPAGQSLDLQALIDVGESNAREGMAALQAWWTSLPNAAKHAFRTTLPAWKRTAEEVDGNKGGAV